MLKTPCLIRNVRYEECAALLELERKATGMNKRYTHKLERFLSGMMNSGLVAVRRVELVGFLFFKVVLQQSVVYLDQLVVSREVPFTDVAGQLVDQMLAGLPEGDTEIIVNTVVPERDVPLQLLLANRGFRCDEVMKDHFGPDNDGLMFHFTKRKPSLHLANTPSLN